MSNDAPWIIISPEKGNKAHVLYHEFEKVHYSLKILFQMMITQQNAVHNALIFSRST